MATSISPTPEQLRHVAAVEQLCANLWQRHPQARCFAHLRVHSSGRTRDLLLGSESLLAGPVAVIDWERAPLAEVFLAHGVDDDYEIDLDDDRSVEGTVLARDVLVTVPGRLLAIDDGRARLIRDPDSGAWSVHGSALRSPLRPRDARERGKISSPIEVELDPVQRSAVELPADRSALILGEAGFGKTTVALHRLARLRAEALAQPAPRKQPFKALVLVPTPGLRRLLIALLERIGVRDVEVATFYRWIARQGRAVFPDLPARDSRDAPIAVSRVKRHPALRSVLPQIIAGTAAMREIEAGYRDDERARTQDQLLHLFGDRALLEQVAREAATEAGPALTPRMLDQVIAHTKIQFSPTTEHAYADVDADKLATVDGLAIDEGTPQQDAETVDPEDFAVLFELQHLRSPARLPTKLDRYDHIVVDEAQEFAALELAVIGRARREGGSITVAGDDRQQVDETIAFLGWPQVLAELGVADQAQTVVLQESYRCPPTIEAFARGLFTDAPAPVAGFMIAGDVDPTLRVSEAAHELELVAMLAAALLELRLRDRLASVAVVCRYAASARRMYALLSKAVECRLVIGGDFRFGPGISVTCVDEVKGLEFDLVIVPDAGAANYPDNGEARRALYVAATRAMSRLWLLSSGRASPLLGP